MTPRPRLVAPVVRRLLVATGILLHLAPPAASAQASTTRGLSVGVRLMGTSLEVENGDAAGGGGLGLHLGYGFNRIVTGFVNIDGSRVDVTEGASIGGQWDLSHGEVGARFHFANSLRRWVPYLEASVGGRSVTVQNASVAGQPAGEVSFSGSSVTFGGGLSTYITRKVAFDASLKFTGGTFTKVDVGAVSVNNLDIDASSFRIGFGFVWWPKA